MEGWVEKLSPELFWDVDRSTVDPDKNSRWLLERVLQRGRWEDWLLVRTNFSKERLNRLRPSLRLDAKSANFLDLYCGFFCDPAGIPAAQQRRPSTSPSISAAANKNPLALSNSICRSLNRLLHMEFASNA